MKIHNEYTLGNVPNIGQNVPNVLVKTYPMFWSKRTQIIFFCTLSDYEDVSQCLCIHNTNTVARLLPRGGLLNKSHFFLSFFFVDVFFSFFSFFSFFLIIFFSFFSFFFLFFHFFPSLMYIYLQW